MDTHVRTPRAIFSLPQQLVVPLFQRPYVWDEANQWEPLWQDIRRLSEYQLGHPGLPATHFLGAVVIRASEGSYGAMQAWSIIDGQQRLTTLQVVFDAAALGSTCWVSTSSTVSSRASPTTQVCTSVTATSHSSCGTQTATDQRPTR